MGDNGFSELGRRGRSQVAEIDANRAWLRAMVIEAVAASENATPRCVDGNDRRCFVLGYLLGKAELPKHEYDRIMASLHPGTTP